MDNNIKNKIEKLLHEIGYYELDFQHRMKLSDGKTMYGYIGYIDAPLFIQVFISADEVEVMDCYSVENNYVQSRKLSLEEFLTKY